ncbi:MAG: hypothetical protein AAGJ29_07105, partial [Pseudomonadota bacterium]
VDGSTPEITWAGLDDVERVILVGTPNGGSVEALEQLVDGYDIGRPVLPHYPAAILGTFPSVYQLLSRPRQHRVHYDDDAESPVENLYDIDLWEKYGWSLASRSDEMMDFLEDALPDVPTPEARHEIAVAYLAAALKRAEAFHKALDAPAERPAGLDLYLVAGDAEPTPYRLAINRETGRARTSSYGPGDGRVPRWSALLDERRDDNWQPTVRSPIDFDGVTFLAASHIGLTSDPSFADNALYLLLEDPRH